MRCAREDVAVVTAMMKRRVFIGRRLNTAESRAGSTEKVRTAKSAEIREPTRCDGAAARREAEGRKKAEI